MPRWQWLPILHGIILRIRPARSAKAYRKVWTDEGSPLLLESQALADNLLANLEKRVDGQIFVELGMSYGEPSIPGALDKLLSNNLRQLLVIPLYPQYSATTVGSVVDQLADYLKQCRNIPELSVTTAYHDEPAFIDALRQSVQTYWENNGRGERLLMSFHGIPRRYLDSGDPYHCQCQKTGRLLAESLGLATDQWALSFQSRVGREEWLRPYTDEMLAEWGRSGAGDIDVICPGFSVDCLETLEEIAMQNAEDYRRSGGGTLNYIPCLNSDAAHVEFLTDFITRRISRSAVSDEQLLIASQARAIELGARR